MSYSDAVSRPVQMYRMIWRWHFYAGLFCIPFVLWLAVTGTIYLFKPQVESLIDRPYDTLTITDRNPPSAQVRAALAALPGSTLRSVELPASPSSATRIIVSDHGTATRVYIDPGTLAVLKTVPEDRRLMAIVSHLHGELLMGNTGSIVIELAASWAIVMIVTGLYLWWPRSGAGLAGIVYPRLSGQGRVFWRDLHAVTGLWVSVFTLFILLSGLPWAKSWGSYLKEIRQVTGIAAVKQDWPIGAAIQKDRPGAAMAMDDMAGMAGMDSMPGMAMKPSKARSIDYAALDRVISAASPLGLAVPVLVSPPASPGGGWTVKSDAQNRILRSDVTVDGGTGQVLSRVDFGQKQVVDRIVGVGIAAHEGHLFGWLNQLVSLLTALGLIGVCASAIILWWRRRPVGMLGAPQPIRGAATSAIIIGIVVIFGVLLPLLGASLIAVLIVERLILSHLEKARQWLGLQPRESSL
jgi:uncharacterized iron-regulated membrane protein